MKYSNYIILFFLCATSLAGKNIYLDLSKKDLRKENFKGKNFEYAQLAKSNLEGIKMHEVGQITRTDMSNTQLVYANLRNADLSQARFFRANLAFADLTNAKLYSTNMVGTNLKNANISGAIFKDVAMSYIEKTNVHKYIETLEDLRKLGAIWDKNNPPKILNTKT